MRVDELLQEKNIDYKVSGRDYVVKCLSPDHEDSNPSMRIDNITGVFNCFSCGFRGNLFKHFGAAANFLEIKRQKLKDSIDEKRSASIGLSSLKASLHMSEIGEEFNPKHISISMLLCITKRSLMEE